MGPQFLGQCTVHIDVWHTVPVIDIYIGYWMRCHPCRMPQVSSMQLSARQIARVETAVCVLQDVLQHDER